MPKIEASVTINRPVSEVFRFATNFVNSPQWQPDVREVHQTDDKPRIGVMVTQVRSTYMLTTRLDLNVDIVGYALNKQLEYKGVIGRFPANGVMLFASSGGTTTVKEIIDIRMGILFAVFSPMLKIIMTGRTRRALGKLKTVMESKSTVAPTNFQSEL
jgi:uncharacterized membrane protein